MNHFCDGSLSQTQLLSQVEEYIHLLKNSQNLSPYQIEIINFIALAVGSSTLESSDDSVAIVWDIGDIQRIARSNNVCLSNAESRSILSNLKDNFDAGIGIDWLTIENEINSFIKQRGESIYPELTESA